MVWYGMVWYGMVWYGMVWYGMVWYGMVWYGMVWYGMVWYGMVWYGMVWYGMVWYGMVWYGMVCHAIPNQTMPYHTKSNHTVPYMLWCGKIWYGTREKNKSIAVGLHCNNSIETNPVAYVSSPTFGRANANFSVLIDRIRNQFLKKRITILIKICICMTKCRAGFATEQTAKLNVS